MAGSRIGQWLGGVGWVVFLRQVFMVVVILVGVVGSVHDIEPMMKVLSPALLVAIAWGFFGLPDKDGL